MPRGRKIGSETEQRATAPIVPDGNYFNIRISDQDVRLTREALKIDDLRFDPDNIRFVDEKKKDKDFTQQEIYDFFKKLDGTSELVSGIRANGGLMDPLIVKRAPIGNVVVEGNRRLACLKTLSREDAKFQTAECGILPQGLSDIDIATYLAQIHVIGKKPWPTQNKAWLVYWMNGGNAHLPYSVIAKNFGMSKSTVQRMIEAYQYTAQYYKDFNDEKWLRKYSYFDEAYKGRSKLAKLHKDYLEMEDDKEKLSKKFLNWFGTLIFEKRLTRGEDVRDMLKMFDKKDEEAINELAKHGIKSAMAIFNVHHPEETDKIYGAIEMATLALQNIKMMDIEELAQDNTRIQLLKNLQGSTDQILRYVDAVRARRGRS